MDDSGVASSISIKICVSARSDEIGAEVKPGYGYESRISAGMRIASAESRLVQKSLYPVDYKRIIDVNVNN
jgi:hypothetical protein